MSDVELRKELYRLIDTQSGDQLSKLYDVVKMTLGIHKCEPIKKDTQTTKEY